MASEDNDMEDALPTDTFTTHGDGVLCQEASSTGQWEVLPSAGWMNFYRNFGPWNLGTDTDLQQISTHLPEKEHWSLQCSLFHRLSASLSARGQPISEKALASVVAFAIKNTLDTFHQDLPRLDEDQRRRFLEITAFDHGNCLVTSLVSGQDKRNIELLVSEWLRIHGYC